MRVFETKWFVRFARREGIRAHDLCEAVARAENGLVDADLGGSVIKQRIARQNEGKSGGYRSILLFRKGAVAFFVYGFPKSARDDVQPNELQGFKELAGSMLAYDASALKKAVRAGALIEVFCHDRSDEKDLSERRLRGDP